jgi:hypothetical protein
VSNEKYFSGFFKKTGIMREDGGNVNRNDLNAQEKLGIIPFSMQTGGAGMKDVKLLVWLSQLGLSTLLPPAACILLSVWLQKQLLWGDWVIVLGAVIGIVAGARGFFSILKTAQSLQKDKKDPPPVSFNEHD